MEVTGKNDVGAITGRRGGQGGISGCAVSGSVKGVENVGGLLGYNDTGGSQSVDEVRVSESYAAVAVTGERFVGGLIGQNLGVVSLCYATGSVTGTAFTGGLIGYDTDTTIWSSFWDKEASGQEGSSGGKGLSTGEMKTLSVYRNAGWNQSAWTMTEGEYPRLAWEQTGAAVLGPPDPLPLSGSGTTDAPYVIHTAADLSQLSWYAEALDAHFVLATDIDCGGTRLYPLGDLGQFEGHFDGQGHSLSNVLIHQPGSDFVGLFSKIGYEGRVSRLRLETVQINGKERVGGLAGEITGGYEVREEEDGSFKVDLTFGVIDGCEVTGAVGAGNFGGGLVGMMFGGRINDSRGSVEVTGESYLGGLVGYAGIGIIDACSATGSVSGQDRVGGLVGFLLAVDVLRHIDGQQFKLGLIRDAVAGGTVSAKTYVGGLAGIQYSAVIDRCFSTGKVTASNWFAGGLVGDNQQGSAVRESYSTGGVEALQSVGGLVGWNTHGTISNAYATGNLAGNSRGGLVESMFVGSIVGGYWDMEATGVAASAGGEGRTTEAMTYPHGADTYTDWDFQAVWAADEDASRNGGYPWLRGVTVPPDLSKPTQR